LNCLVDGLLQWRGEPPGPAARRVDGRPDWPAGVASRGRQQAVRRRQLGFLRGLLGSGQMSIGANSVVTGNKVRPHGRYWCSTSP